MDDIKSIIFAYDYGKRILSKKKYFPIILKRGKTKHNPKKYTTNKSEIYHDMEHSNLYVKKS